MTVYARPRTDGAKITFTGRTTRGRLIMQYISQNLAPATHRAAGRARHPARPLVRERLPLLPAHIAFEGCTPWGIDRGNHPRTLDHYHQPESLLVSHSEPTLGSC